MPPKAKHTSLQKKNNSQTTRGISYWTIAFWVFLCPITAVVINFGVRFYESRSEWIRAVSPHSSPGLVQYEDNSLKVPVGRDMFWGTYRSALYFGMRTRSASSLLFGLMWHRHGPTREPIKIRYLCDQNDGLLRYGWKYHDGRRFGIQEIVETQFAMNISFVKQPDQQGGHWTARIDGIAPTRYASEQISIVLVLSHEKTWTLEPLVSPFNGEVVGHSEDAGKFHLGVSHLEGVIAQSFLVESADPHFPESLYESRVRTSTKKGSKRYGLPNTVQLDRDGDKPPVLLIALQVRFPFSIEITLRSNSDAGSPLEGDAYLKALSGLTADFNNKLQERFGLRSSSMNQSSLPLLQLALSNMLGSVGYFHGNSKIRLRSNELADYFGAGLYSAVPSRSFFPRGFLWDEGFHNLLLSHWDKDISLDILRHWLDLLNMDGWIPREQILGIEAKRKVPDKFIVQSVDNANPPTFFLTIGSLIAQDLSRHGGLSEELRKFLVGALPRLEAWYQWYNTTQTGLLPLSFRWRGRDPTTILQLNPITLTSGLDDYPRASHPTEEERHVDLYCWIAFSTRLLVKIKSLLGMPTDIESSYSELLYDNANLNRLHWSEDLQSYADWGMHTDNVVLTRSVDPNTGSIVAHRTVLTPPSVHHVNAFGYVSLFPMLLQILKPDSLHLKTILDRLHDPTLLWTKYGLRSLASTSPLYATHNTLHDPPYWRSAIWINFNFLALRALHFYRTEPGPYTTLAGSIYSRLRVAVVKNVQQNFDSTGYIYEQYNDVTGRGQGSHPFTGWSSLVVLIITEQYD